MEFKLNKRRKIFHFSTPIQFKGDWMLVLISPEVYNSIFNTTEENNKFELYTDPFDSDFPINDSINKVAEVLGLSDFSVEDLEHEIYGPKNIKTYKKLSTERVRLMVIIYYY